MKIKIAFGTDDGKELTKEHFGSAKYYLVYALDTKTKEISFIKKMDNKTPEEEKHGDPKKAKEVSQLMKDTKVLVGLVMGPNIIRMRKKFVPVISREKNIEKAIELLKNKIAEIGKELKKPEGEDKEVIYLE